MNNGLISKRKLIHSGSELLGTKEETKSSTISLVSERMRAAKPSLEEGLHGYDIHKYYSDHWQSYAKLIDSHQGSGYISTVINVECQFFFGRNYRVILKQWRFHDSYDSDLSPVWE
jgi:hypothetical protein